MNNKQRHGPARWLNACRYSFRGFAFAWRHESAIREELLGLLVLVPLAWWLSDTALEAAILIAVLGLVVIVELLNSALEAAIDHFDTQHELFGAAKDMGSAAVMVALIVAFLTWLLVLL